MGATILELGLRFRVEALGFSVQGLGLRIWAFRV